MGVRYYFTEQDVRAAVQGLIRLLNTDPERKGTYPIKEDDTGEI